MKSGVSLPVAASAILCSTQAVTACAHARNWIVEANRSFASSRWQTGSRIEAFFLVSR